MKKSDREIMEILEAFDATGSAHSAAVLAGVDAKTVRRYVAARDAGVPVTGPGRRPKMIDGYLPKIEEWVERSSGKVRADVVHERLVALGFTGTERTTRRAVAQVKAAWRAGHRRTYRPWITEPGLWLQFDWAAGPKVPGPDGSPRRTWLFCAWLAWSRFRVVIPVWDQTLPTLITCLDATLHRLGGVPTYVLTDNPRTVSIDHVAGVAVRHPQIVEVGIDEAVTAAQGYLDEWLAVPDGARRDLAKLSTTPNASAWGNTTWRGLRALAGYARDRKEGWDGGGFWQWCESGRPGTWPATVKKLSMTESDSVLNSSRHYDARLFPVDEKCDRSGRVHMVAHLKIAEGGGNLAPRVYFLDDTAGTTGKVHVGFVGPHYLVPNKSTN